jgi:hypothetical protein
MRADRQTDMTSHFVHTFFRRRGILMCVKWTVYWLQCLLPSTQFTVTLPFPTTNDHFRILVKKQNCWGLKFCQRWRCRLWFSGLWHRVYVITNASMERTASIFRTSHNPEDHDRQAKLIFCYNRCQKYIHVHYKIIIYHFNLGKKRNKHGEFSVAIQANSKCKQSILYNNKK